MGCPERRRAARLQACQATDKLSALIAPATSHGAIVSFSYDGLLAVNVSPRLSGVQLPCQNAKVAAVQEVGRKNKEGLEPGTEWRFDILGRKSLYGKDLTNNALPIKARRIPTRLLRSIQLFASEIEERSRQQEKHYEADEIARGERAENLRAKSEEVGAPRQSEYRRQPVRRVR